jgi:hypothetical protein
VPEITEQNDEAAFNTRRRNSMNLWRNRLALVAVALVLALAPGIAIAQAVIKVNDNVNFKIGILLQGQWDEQQVANATNTDTGGWQQNMLIRRARINLAGQVAPNVFFFVDTENANLGKSTQTLTSGTTGVKAPVTGFSLLDAVGEWRIAKEFNIQFGEILVPVNRWILTSAASTFMLDQSAYNAVQSSALQNQSGRDTGFMVRGWFLDDHLEYRSAFLSGLRLPGVKNAFRYTEWLQYDVLDTEVYNMPSYAGANYGNKKILALAGGYDVQSDYTSSRPTCSWTSRPASARSSRRSSTSTSTAASSSRRFPSRTRSRPRRACSSRAFRSPRSSATSRRRSI